MQGIWDQVDHWLNYFFTVATFDLCIREKINFHYNCTMLKCCIIRYLNLT